ncbi:unnamed protein product [Rotaria sp. Silwood2]|nr:unnamed protein product [Rotaria sp. Silwood2]CAF2986126.1 unnamed protein product [Rotaria sp. Silwood2]CAF3382993.1 unnamed protein product [Rotaria sp. Silwood2]CAF4169134.1 unnamed protein product [Rotaria sp. Silwood2]CAF4181236.1 unnamed protein product [Rotaria sp. Silwood2]
MCFQRAPQLRDDGLRSHVRSMSMVQDLHPHIFAQRFQLAKKEALQVLDKLKIPIKADRETLIKIARTCLRRKLSIENVDILTDVCIYLFFFHNRDILF